MTFSQRGLRAQWLKALVFVLFGYCLLGKTFAYTFAGEMVLVVGVLIFLFSGRISLIFSDPVLLMWTMFAFWGLCRTIPFVAVYGIDAPRDAVVWGYGLIAVLVVAFVNSSSLISRALNTYRKFLRWYLPVLPALIYLSVTLRDSMPHLPWADSVRILSLRGGEAGVHLAGAGLFLLIFSDRKRGSKKEGLSIWYVVAFLGFALAALMLAMESRGGFVAMIIPILLVSAIRTKTVGWRVVGLGVVAAVLGLIVLEAHPPQIKGETFTADKVVTVIGSIAGDEDAAPAHGGTKQWRIKWWKKIIDYTFSGPYFWTGKGFGVNLAREDKPSGMSEEDSKLRSPHNGHMTVIARTGVPGTLLWLALNGVFVSRLIQGFRLGQRSGSRFWSSLNLWVFSYWLAAVINMSFDVYLEGPQGGIWFWSLIGLGTAAYRVQVHESRQAAARASVKATTVDVTDQQPDAEEITLPVIHSY